MYWLRARLSYANVMATIALFAAMGGGAYAATSSPWVDGSGAIHACISNRGSLSVVRAGKRCPKNATALSFGAQGQPGPAGAQGPAGPQGIPGTAGQNGTAGASGATHVVVRVGPGTSVPANSTTADTAQCNPGEVATGGGGEAPTIQVLMTISRPVPSTAGSTPTGWTVWYRNNDSSPRTVTAYAVCASP